MVNLKNIDILNMGVTIFFLEKFKNISKNKANMVMALTEKKTETIYTAAGRLYN